MTSIRVRAAIVIAGVGAFVAILCAATARVSSIDPVAIWEIAGGVALVVWLALMLRGVAAGARLSAALASASQAAVLHGVQCRVVRDGGRHAFVAGAFRPVIFIGDELLLALDADELFAVLQHEEHHRRTFAPLRAAAFEAWLALARP